MGRRTWRRMRDNGKEDGETEVEGAYKPRCQARRRAPT